MFMYGMVIREIISIVLFVVAVVAYVKCGDCSSCSRRDKILGQSLGIVCVILVVVVWQRYLNWLVCISLPKREWFMMVVAVVWGWRK